MGLLPLPGRLRHITVGAGDGPCAILMVGSRRKPNDLLYPVSAVAARHGASVPAETNTGREAYADWPGEFVPARLPWPVV